MSNQISRVKNKPFITIISYLFVIIMIMPVIVNAQEEISRDKIPQNIPEDVKNGIEMLLSNSSKEQTKGADKLGKLGSKAIAAEPFLVEILPNRLSLYWSPPGLAGIGGEPTTPGVEAAKALWKIKGSEGLDFLTQLFEKGNSDIKVNIAQAMGKIGDQNAKKFLIAKLKDSSPEVRITAAEGLFWGNNYAFALDPLITALKDNNSEVRENASKALRWYNDKRMVKPLIQALNDPEPTVRCNTAEILGMLKDRRAVDPLIKALNERISWVRGAIVRALVEIRDTRAIQPLIMAMVEWGDEHDDISKALDEIEPNWQSSEAAQSAVSQLLEAVKSSQNKIRENAIIVLGSLGDKRAVNALITALNDRYEDNRENAAVSLGKIKDTRAVEPLIKIVQDKNRRVRVRAMAALALANINDPRAVDPLIETLKEKKWEFLVEKAAIALGEIGDPRARAPLQVALKDMAGATLKTRRSFQEALQKLRK